MNEIRNTSAFIAVGSVLEVVPTYGARFFVTSDGRTFGSSREAENHEAKVKDKQDGRK